MATPTQRSCDTSARTRFIRSPVPEAHMQPLQAAGDDGRLVAELAVQDLDRGELPRKVDERFHHLQTGQRCSQAGMNALPEGRVPVWRAADVQRVGVGEPCRVPVRRVLDKQDAIVLLDLAAEEVERLL